MEAVVNPELTQKALDDFQLVEQARRGCQRAYTRLMDRHRNAIFHLMYRMTNDREDAQDLTMEAFGKAFTRLSSYVPNYAFSTWLYRIAVNNGIDFVRKKRLSMLSIDSHTKPDGEQDFTELLCAGCPDPEETIIREQRIWMLHDLLDRLSLKYRRMIELRYFDEMSYEEIAIELNIPLGTVKAQLFRAKELLAEMLTSPGARAYLDVRVVA